MRDPRPWNTGISQFLTEPQAVTRPSPVSNSILESFTPRAAALKIPSLGQDLATSAADHLKSFIIPSKWPWDMSQKFHLKLSASLQSQETLLDRSNKVHIGEVAREDLLSRCDGQHAHQLSTVLASFLMLDSGLQVLLDREAIHVRTPIKQHIQSALVYDYEYLSWFPAAQWLVDLDSIHICRALTLLPKVPCSCAAMVVAFAAHEWFTLEMVGYSNWPSLPGQL